MAVDNKGRLLFILRYLQAHTDENHEVTTSEMKQILAENGYPTKDRRTIVDDVLKLKESGYDVEVNENTGFCTSFCYTGWNFDVPELKMLIDAVNSASFIPEGIAQGLIDKLTDLTSTYHAEELKATIYQSDRISTANGSINHVIARVNEAIINKKKICFQYWDYNLNKEKVLHNNGEQYFYSPYALVWNDGHYYMLGIVDKRPEDINPFRVDLMCMPVILDEPAVPAPEGFDPDEISKKVFKMFSGEDKEVVLEVDNSLMKKIIDKFGENFKSEPASENTFRATVNASVSSTFYSWIFQYDGQISILEPQDVREQYLEMLQRVTRYAEEMEVNHHEK